MSALALLDELSQFTGTEQYYKHWLNKRMVITDGVRHFVTNAGGGAYWFIDILATEVFPKHKLSRFLSVVMTVKDNHAKIKVTNGNESPKDVLFKKEVEYTDCPEGEWKFFMILDDDMSVVLLPSEY